MSPRTAAFLLASLVGLAIATDLLWMPVQVNDTLEGILEAQASPSVWASFENDLRADERRVRALGVAQTKALYDAAAGEHYWLVFRGFHAALLVTALLIFTAAQRVSTPVDLAASAFALVVFVGLRAFRGHVQEAFPINAMIEIVALALLTLNLARSRGGWGRDLAAVLAFAAAALTLESGLLLWVIAAGAWMVGWRGISMRAIVVMTILLAGYLYLRFAVLSISAGLPDRSTGFWLALLEPEEVQQRFGDRAVLLYAYNVAAAALSVLFSEPSHGVFVTTRAWLDGDLLPRVAIPALTSTATTGLIVWAGLSSRRAGSGGHRGHAEPDTPGTETRRFLVLLAIVLPANAVLSYSYLKDEIMVVAAAFYALGAFYAMRAALQFVARAPKATAVAVIMVLALLATGWSVRAAGMHFLMRSRAFKHQNDWVHMPAEWKRRERWPEDPASQQLILQLRDAAVRMEVPNHGVGEPRWVGRVWED